MGTTTAKATDDGVQRYTSVTRTINSVDDMRAFIAAHNAMIDSNPELTKETFETVDTNEFMSSIANY